MNLWVCKIENFTNSYGVLYYLIDQFYRHVKVQRFLNDCLQMYEDVNKYSIFVIGLAFHC